MHIYQSSCLYNVDKFTWTSHYVCINNAQTAEFNVKPIYFQAHWVCYLSLFIKVNLEMILGKLRKIDISHVLHLVEFFFIATQVGG